MDIKAFIQIQKGLTSRYQATIAIITCIAVSGLLPAYAISLSSGAPTDSSNAVHGSVQLKNTGVDIISEDGTLITSEPRSSEERGSDPHRDTQHTENKDEKKPRGFLSGLFKHDTSYQGSVRLIGEDTTDTGIIIVFDEREPAGYEDPYEDPITIRYDVAPEIREQSVVRDTVSTDVVEEDDPIEILETPMPATDTRPTGEAELLAKLIYHEAGNQPYDGRVAVAEVVVNRVNSPIFPNNVHDVIYQSGQFQGVGAVSGSPVTEENLGIASRVIAGEERVFYNPEVLYFRNPMITSNLQQSAKINWGLHKWYTYIGGHTFYTQN